VLNESRRRIAGSGAQSIDDVRAAGRALVGFSEALAGEERELKRFLYAKLYGSRQLEEVRLEAQRVISNLANAYRSDAALLPDGWRHPGDRTQQLRTIGDFIAGMTDRFAIARHEELVGAVDLARDRF